MAIEAQLLKLWKQAFGEHDGFWEMFLEKGYSPRRCMHLAEGEKVTAALCWFDTESGGQKWAYVYAVVTAPEYRGRGLCRALFRQAEVLWQDRGYAGALLVPAKEGLREMYRKMGYETCTCIREFSCPAGEHGVSLRVVSPEEFAGQRRKMLPQGSVIQEGENLAFLAAQGELLAGKDILLAAWREGEILQVMELLGDAAKAPGIVKALGCETGNFRVPGKEKPWAMGKKFREDADFPKYFGYAFD